uniref:WAP domain-containing protein n=1 Tax=Haemonchus contortus TaxID=6289 RepID=A0A7I4YV36_HAECO
MIITLLFLELLLDLARAQWGFNPFGGPGPVPPYPPGNNIGVGYPTAYGLWFGRGNWNNLLEIEELLRIMENMKTSISPTPVEAFKLCLPSDGVCVTDDDCTTSRRCKEGCCYEE